MTLIEELEAWVKARKQCANHHCQKDSEEVDEILSRHKKDESLAELADRKGRWIAIEQFSTGWDITIGEKGKYQVHNPLDNNKTYAEAESKARAYLESLEDKK